MGNRDVIRQLARSAKLAAAVHHIAEEVADDARKIDRTAKVEVRDIVLPVNGLNRVVTTVTNTAPNAAQKEFGGAQQDGWRPIGRAASRHGG